MARRDLSIMNEVGPEVVKDGGNFAESALQIGEKIIAASQEAKITENLSKAQLDLNTLNQKYKLDYQGDPFSKQGSTSYQQERKELFDSYGEDISPLFRNSWLESTRDMSAKDDLGNQTWAYTQARKNTESSINKSLLASYQMANQDGLRYGTGEGGEVDVLLNYSMAESRLKKLAQTTLGSTDTEGLFRDARNSYIKSFISGVAETNPERALEMIQDEQFKETFTAEERDEFLDVTAKAITRQNTIKKINQTDNTSEVITLVNDNAKSYYEKRLAIDTLELSGGIETSTAEKARRVLRSKNELSAITSEPVMSDLITRIYDLNAMQDTNSEDYLVGIQNVKQDILDKQAEGDLSAPDAQKLNNQLKTLSSAKIADATQRVGVEFYDAKELFNTLPPEYRGAAIRDLFYQTHGQKELSPETYNDRANTIINEINTERRNKTTKRLQLMQATDIEFLEGHGITSEEVAEAARNRGVPESEIIKVLKSHLVNQ